MQLPPPPVASAEDTSALCPHTGGWLALHRRVGHSHAHTYTQPGPALLSAVPGPAWPQQAEQADPKRHRAYLWLDPVWAAALGTGHKSRLQSREQGANFGKEF